MRTYTESEHRAAEDKILRDMDRLELVGGGQGRSSDEVKAAAGSGAAIVLVLIVCVVLAVIVGGCGTVAGFGDDLRQWSLGIRGSVQSGPTSEPGR